MPKPGRQLGPYEILAPLGAGGMGEVYRARDPRFRREVAVKVLPAELAQDPDSLKRFEREARAVGALNHPNILTVHDLGTEDGLPYLVTELLEGETLRERLKRGPLPVAKVLDWAVQITRGLVAAHDKGVVHRDLKPENLFVTREGRVKILDFGLARQTPEGHARKGDSTVTEVGTVMGTAGYMAPEQVLGERADTRADLFAIGCVIYEMLAGNRPFQGETAVQVMSAILTEDPRPIAESRPEAPAGIEAIVRSCLHKNPEERFQSARDLGFALEALALTSESGAGAATRETAMSRVPMIVRVALAVIVSAAALAGAIVVGGRSRQVPTPSFKRLTFQRGTVGAARFSPDGQTIVYSAAWNGRPPELFSTRLDGPESRPLGFAAATLQSVSSKGEMALSLHPELVATTVNPGTLARASLAGGAAREMLEAVEWADWAPDGQSIAIARQVGVKRRLEMPPNRILCETSGAISFPRVSPRGNLVAFFDHHKAGDTRGSVAVVDLKGSVRTLSSGWEALEGLAWNPAGTQIWFTGAISGTAFALHAVDLRGRTRLVTRVPGRLRLQDISPDGRVLLAFDAFRTELRGKGAGDAGERDLSWLDHSEPADISADGKTLLLTDDSEGIGPNYGVGLRGMDGSPVVRLGDGAGAGLSPDGKWVIAIISTSPGQLVLYPTGPGESKTLAPNQFETYYAAQWLRDGRHVAFSANRRWHGVQIFVLDVENADLRPVTPEGAAGLSTTLCVSPDGRFILTDTQDSKGRLLYPVAGGAPQTVSGSFAGEAVIRFSSDGRSLFVNRFVEVPAKIYRVDIATGRHTLCLTLAPPDPAGVPVIYLPVMTGDATAYAYAYPRTLSTLYVASGLK